jgi:hypothetical protein
VVYQDQITAQSDIPVARVRGIPMGIENDQITGGRRVVFDKSGQKIYEMEKPRQLASSPGTWVNVDGRLGVVMVKGTGMAYAQASGYSPGISVCADLLYGSYSDQSRKFKAGEEVQSGRGSNASRPCLSRGGRTKGNSEAGEVISDSRRVRNEGVANKDGGRQECGNSFALVNRLFNSAFHCQPGYKIGLRHRGSDGSLYALQQDEGDIHQ